MITAQFNDAFLPTADGVVQGVKNYALWLNRKYGDAYVVAPEYPDYTDNEEFEVIRVKSIPYLSRKPYRIGLPEISFEAKRKLLEAPLDIIHARSPFGVGNFALQMAKEKNIPMVASFHTQYYYDIKEQVKSERLTRRVLKTITNFYEKADAVWTVNQKTAQTLKSYGYKGDIDIIGNGIDFNVPEDISEIRYSAGKSLEIAEDEFVMLYVGQLVWHKNLKLICDSLVKVKNAGYKFRMIFVGEGDAKEELVKMVETIGITRQTTFLGKISSREKVLSIYARGDLFLFPSLYDTFGIVVREAAALSCPCIMIKGSNVAQGIEDLKNGFLSSANSDSFSSIIIKIMNNEALLKRVGATAAATLPESWESVVDRAYLKYEDVIRQFNKGKK